MFPVVCKILKRKILNASIPITLILKGKRGGAWGSAGEKPASVHTTKCPPA